MLQVPGVTTNEAARACRSRKQVDRSRLLCRAVAVAAAVMLSSPANSKPADLDARLSQTYAAIDSALATSSMPGLVVGVTDRNQRRKIIVHGYSDMKARMPLTAESRFAIGSVSKAFTAVALLQLMDEGRFDPQAPITRYLPWFAVKSQFVPITARHLMSHTSGLPNYLADASSSRFVIAKLRDFEPTYAPGAHWWYSNTGYQLLGYVLENIEGASYRTIIQRRILDRLGMTSSTAVIDDAERARMPVSYALWPFDGKYVEEPWFEYAAGDGSIVSNAVDMCAYMRFILNRGASANGRLLSEKAFAMLTTPVLNDYAYGLHVHTVNDATLISHTGGIAGFHSEVEAHMDDGFALVFLSNGGIDQILQKWIVQSVTAAYRGVAPPALPAQGRDPDNLDPQAYVDIYHLAAGDTAAVGGTVEFVVTDGRLALMNGDTSAQLERMGTDAFCISSLDSDRFPFFFGRVEGTKDGKIVEVSHGSKWYITKGFVGVPQPAAPRSYAAYVGRFENNGPEGPAARVFVRNGRLMVVFLAEGTAAQALEPAGVEGVFRLAEPAYSPEFFHFDTVIEGHALRLDISGVPLYRKDTP
jgi:D-alanyl-D-alanine carboxypeptidase